MHVDNTPQELGTVIIAAISCFQVRADSSEAKVKSSLKIENMIEYQEYQSHILKRTYI